MNYQRKYGVLKIIAKYDSICTCRKNILKGDSIYYDFINKKAYCPSCSTEIGKQVRAINDYIRLKYGEQFFNNIIQ